MIGFFSIRSKNLLVNMATFVPDQQWRRPSTDASKASLSRVQNIIGDFDPDYTMKYYDEWSKHYEDDLKVCKPLKITIYPLTENA